MRPFQVGKYDGILKSSSRIVRVVIRAFFVFLTGYISMKKKFSWRTVGAVAVLASLGMAAAHADEPFLTVGGNVNKALVTGGKKDIVFTRAQFDALPQATVTTTTSWQKGPHVFKGPLMRDLQKAVGGSGPELDAYAVDDYMQKIPTADFTKYDVILASTMDGKPLPLEHYGPLWVIYPRDQFPQELKNPMTDGKFVWQVNRVVFK